MFTMFEKMFSYQFMVRAFTVGSLVSLCAALLGVSLVLKRYSMIGDGLSHVGFGSLAVATALGWAPMLVTIPVVMGSAFFLLRLSSRGKTRGDSAIALISTGALAIGVMVLSLSRGMTTDINNYLFGSVLAINATDAKVSIILAVIILILYLIFFRSIFSITFDETYARATGRHADTYHILLALMTAVIIVIGMRLMGAMLISSLIVFPAISAMRVCKTYRSVSITAAVISVLAYFLGLCASYLLSTPAGASVVVVNIIEYLICFLIGKTLGRG